jgi:type I restriction enzyme R subunit
VLNLRAKLDASGYYDDFEVERVVAVELDHYVFRENEAERTRRCVGTVADRLMKRYKAAQESLRVAQAEGNATA